MKTAQQLLWYGFVGVTSNLLGYLAYLLLSAFVLPPLVAMSVLYAIGSVISFVGNRKLTFKHYGALGGAVMRYCIVYFLGWVLNYLCLYIAAVRMGYPHQIVQAIAIIAIAFYLFIALRYFVFPRSC